MMPVRVLAEAPSSSLVFLLQPRNYTQLHNKLRSMLGEDEARLFSRPDVYSSHTTWSVDLPDAATPVRSYGSLGAVEKSGLDERMSLLGSSVRSRLSGDREMSQLVDGLFEIPGLEDIHAYEIGGVLQPVFTRWGCRPGKERVGSNPLEHIMERQSHAVSPVRLGFRYSDGRTASETDFLFSFSGRESVFRTDESGSYDLGKLRQGTAFTVYELNGAEKGRSFGFIVEPGGSYEVSLPVYMSGDVVVEDQHGKRIPGFRFVLRQGLRKQECKTDGDGKSHVEGLEVGARAEAEGIDRKGASMSFEPGVGDREWHWRVEERYLSNLRIVARDGVGGMLPRQSLSVSIGGREEEEMETGSDGALELKGLEPGTVVSVAEKSRPYNRSSVVLREGENELELKVGGVAAAGSGFIRVRVLNHRGERMRDTRVETEYRNTVVEHRTDDEGEIVLSKEGMIDETRVKARIHVPALDRRGSVRERVHEKSFLYTTNREAYDLKLTRIGRWWWLAALLLIPLILLIRFEKDVHVRVYAPDKVTPMSGVDVSLQYHKGYLFDRGRLMTRDTVRFVQATDSAGSVRFEKLGYSLYSYVFQYGSPLDLFAWDECFLSDSLRRKFHAVSDRDTLKLFMRPVTSSMTFTLIDEQTIAPLQGSKVMIVTESGGKRYVDSAISNSEGKVVFRDVPVCGRVIELLGEHVGYLPYQSMGKDVSEFGPEGGVGRVLPLRRNPRYVRGDYGPVDYTGELRTVPCDETVKSGGQGMADIVHPLGPDPGLIVLNYDMADIPDKITITYNGRVVASTGGQVSGKGSIKWYYYPQPGEPNYCTVNIRAPEDGTVWSYVLGCPTPLGPNPYYFIGE
jgi:hypothetical protein